MFVCVFLPRFRAKVEVITMIRTPRDEANAGGLAEALQAFNDDVALVRS